MKKILSFLCVLLLCVCLTPTVSADEALAPYVWDEADVLSDTEEAELWSKLEEISAQYDAQIAVSIWSELDLGGIEDNAANEYELWNYGVGADDSGVLLFIVLDIREYRILCNGGAANAILEEYSESIGDAIQSDLAAGRYAAAVDTFADECAYYLDGAANGFAFDVSGNLVTALVIGAIVGVIVALALKGQLKSVHRQDRATSYVKPGSMHLTQSGDFFMYRTLNRVAKPQNNHSSRSSGSSRHMSGGSF